MDILERLAEELNLPRERLFATVELLDNGNTVPFVARYRKEVTGGMDDAVLRTLCTRLNALRSLEKRKDEVRALIDAQGKLDDTVRAAIENAETVTEVDDVYLPFRPKRRTRASVARERGLSPLAEFIAKQNVGKTSVYEFAADFVNLSDDEKSVKTVEDAIAGARDIVAEEISENAEYRRGIRALTEKYGVISSKKLENAADVYEQYFDYSEAVSKIPPHRILAINRGEKDGALSVSVSVERDVVLDYLFAKVGVNPKSSACDELTNAVRDSYDRLIAPSVEREIRNVMTERAGESAISLFSMNLKNLLLQPPLKGKTVLGFDPGYRTGCKLAVVTKTGAVAEMAVIYPTKPHERIAESEKTVTRLIQKYGVDVIAIGNGTASGESERFIANLLEKLGGNTKYIIVSEAGASVYSASELGAEEFPDFDVTERSAVSIARRLQDPLAELVKIDPKSIGVGQYQHDMKAARLDEALSGVVEDAVNSVGVDVNTASYSLLSYISGINSASAKNIVKYREENGEFRTRRELMKVSRFGEKAFRQAAGFLRIPGGDEILDNTGVHPESYAVTKKLLEHFGYTVSDVRGGLSLRNVVAEYGLSRLADELGVGEPTLADIISELEKPGRDLRDSLPAPILRDRILDIEDLEEGMTMVGTVRNVIDFGAFVDIGVHRDGLVHISEIADRYIKHPSEVLSVGDVVTVRVLSVDKKKGRISLTMRS